MHLRNSIKKIIADPCHPFKKLYNKKPHRYDTALNRLGVGHIARCQNPRTVDDDCMYPCDWLAMLMDGHHRYPGEVICLRGHRISFDERGEILPYRQWMLDDHTRGWLPDDYNLMPTGIGGVLYPPGSLHPLVLDRELFLRLAPTADDVWFKACSMLAKSPPGKKL